MLTWQDGAAPKQKRLMEEERMVRFGFSGPSRLEWEGGIIDVTPTPVDPSALQQGAGGPAVSVSAGAASSSSAMEVDRPSPATHSALQLGTGGDAEAGVVTSPIGTFPGWTIRRKIREQPPEQRSRYRGDLGLMD